MAPAPFLTRTTPLGVTSWGKSIRIYSQADSGDLREAHGDLDVDKANTGPSVGNIPTFKPRDWRSGTAHAPAVLGSAIAVAQSSEGQHIRIYYQDNDLRLAELCQDNLNDHWFKGEFQTDAAVTGTSISVVQDPSLGAFGYHIFFQGKDQAIYQCSHNDSGWTQPTEIVDRALPQTALSGVIWNDGDEIRLYWQDVGGSVRELSQTRHGDWREGEFADQANALSDLFAVAFDGQIRVYVQEPSNDIVEWVWNKGWSKTDFRAPALPSSDIKAVVHDFGEQKAVLLYFVGPDKILQERVQIAGQHFVGWIPDIGYVAPTAQTGDFIGSVTGTGFSDFDAGAGNKTIKRVICWNGDGIDGIGFEYVDGSKTAFRGQTGGMQAVFELQDGEEIVQVLVRGTDRPQAIQFVTSSARQSPEFGSQRSGPARQLLWEYQGQPLAGFTGSADTVGVSSLKPLWAARPARVGNAVPNKLRGSLMTMSFERGGDLNSLMAEANSLEQSKNTISSKVDGYNASVPQMKTGLINAVKAPTDAAIGDTIKLGESIVTLSTASGTAKRNLIAVCKAISKKVNAKFEVVSGTANSKLGEFDKTATDIVYWQSQADGSIGRVQEMLEITEATKNCADQAVRIQSEAVNVAHGDIRRARETRDRAERDKSAKKRDRILRDIFTLGLGEAGDWGGLNSAIDAADEIIRSAEGNERAANEALVRAQSTLTSSEQQIQQFGDLKSRLSGLPGPLHTLKGTLDKQRIDVLSIRSTAFDIAVFMGSLTATTAPLESVRTAADFARGVQALQNLIQTNTKLAGEFITNPNVMDIAIREIVASDVPPADLI